MLTRFLAALALCLPLAALSQYPSQTVRVVVGFPPGGTTDVFAISASNSNRRNHETA